MESLQEAATQERGMRLCELGRRWLWHGGLGEARESDWGAGGSGGGGGRGTGGGGGAGGACCSARRLARACVHQPMRKEPVRTGAASR